MTDEVAALVLRDNYFQTQSLSVSGALAPSAARRAGALHQAPGEGRAAQPRARVPAGRRGARRAPRGEARPHRAGARGAARLLQDRAQRRARRLRRAGRSVRSRPRSSATSRSRCARASRREIHAHPLRREIIATHVTNSMINRVGSTFVHRMQEETGAPRAEVVRAYLDRARGVRLRRRSGARSRRSTTRSPDRVQTAMIIDAGRLIVRATLWFLRQPRSISATSRARSSISRPGAERLAALFPERAARGRAGRLRRRRRPPREGRRARRARRARRRPRRDVQRARHRRGRRAA